MLLNLLWQSIEFSSHQEIQFFGIPVISRMYTKLLPGGQGILIRFAKSTAYLAIHPRGLVPALAVDGGILIESSVINEFIADLAPELKLRPDGPLGQAHGRLWVRRIEETVHPAMGAMIVV